MLCYLNESRRQIRINDIEIFVEEELNARLRIFDGETDEVSMKFDGR